MINYTNKYIIKTQEMEDASRIAKRTLYWALKNFNDRKLSFDQYFKASCLMSRGLHIRESRIIFADADNF